MKEIDITYSPDQVRSMIVMGSGDADSVRNQLVGLLSSFKHLYAFFDKNLLIKSRLAFDLSLELQELNCPMRALDASEHFKTMDSVMDICEWLMEKGADRDAVLLAVGGGITTDLVGFAASIYKRGVRYLSVPTTLLAQVDAGLGGKTGVNFMHYKNILGTVHQPVSTFISPEFLRSLPCRDFLSGAAELLKSFIINDDGGFYERAVNLLKGQDGSPDMKALAPVVEAAARVKAGVVSRDPYEKGERRILNLGHTFAHAIETLSQQQSDVMPGLPVLDARRKKPHTPDVTHGEAVAMGIVLAARLAEAVAEQAVSVPDAVQTVAVQDVEKGLADRLERDFRACGLTVDCPFDIESMAEAMKKDKKAEEGKVHFVLPLSVGKVTVCDMTVDEACGLLKKSKI